MSTSSEKMSGITERQDDSAVLRLIESKAKAEEIYQLGNRFRKGEISGYPKGTFKALDAAFACYNYLDSIGYKDDKLYHNMGVIFYELAVMVEEGGIKGSRSEVYYSEAVHFFSKSKLPASENNIKEIFKHKPILSVGERLEQMVGTTSLDINSPAVQEAIRREHRYDAEIRKRWNLAMDGALQDALKEIPLDKHEEYRQSFETMKEDPEQFAPEQFSNFRTDCIFQKIRSERLAIQARDRRNKEKKIRKEASDPFTAVALSDLDQASSAIHDTVEELGGSENVIIIGIGASPQWYLQTLVSKGYQGKIHSIPISCIQQLNLKGGNVEAYKQFLNSLGLGSSFFSSSDGQKQLLIIDYIDSSRSLINFQKLLIEIDPRFAKNTHLFGIRAMDVSTTRLPYKFPTALVQPDTVSEVAAHRLIRKFVETEWREWRKLKKELMTPLTSPIIQMKKAQLTQLAKLASCPTTSSRNSLTQLVSSSTQPASLREPSTTSTSSLAPAASAAAQPASLAGPSTLFTSEVAGEASTAGMTVLWQKWKEENSEKFGGSGRMLMAQCGPLEPASGSLKSSARRHQGK